MPFETEIRRRGRDRTRLQKMLLFIASQLENPMLGVWIAYDSEEEKKPDDNILGYCIGMVNLLPGFESLYIYRMYAKDKEIREEFDKILRKWGKENKIKKQTITVTKNVKAFRRKHNFSPVSVNMERRI